MRTLIRTQEDLSVFVGSLKTLSLGQLSGAFNKTLKHPEAKATVERAIGKKSDKTISDRQAQELAADLLGFENTHVMAAHFKKLTVEPLYQTWIVLFEYKGDATSYMIGVPEGINPRDLSASELSEVVGAEFNPFSGHDYYKVCQSYGEPLTLESAMSSCDGVVKNVDTTVTVLHDIAGVGVNDDPDDLLVDLLNCAHTGADVDLNMGAIDVCLNHSEVDLLSKSKDEQVNKFLLEMDVFESAIEAFESTGLDAEDRFSYRSGDEYVLVDMRRGYAGLFCEGELFSAVLFGAKIKK